MYKYLHLEGYIVFCCSHHQLLNLSLHQDTPQHEGMMPSSSQLPPLSVI